MSSEVRVTVQNVVFCAGNERRCRLFRSYQQLAVDVQVGASDIANADVSMVNVPPREINGFLGDADDREPLGAVSKRV